MTGKCGECRQFNDHDTRFREHALIGYGKCAKETHIKQAGSFHSIFSINLCFEPRQAISSVPQQALFEIDPVHGF
jgi:hypothetical protein